MTKGDNPKSLNSGKIVDLIQMFGPPVSVLYYLMLVLCILDRAAYGNLGGNTIRFAIRV